MGTYHRNFTRQAISQDGVGQNGAGDKMRYLHRPNIRSPAYWVSRHLEIVAISLSLGTGLTVMYQNNSSISSAFGHFTPETATYVVAESPCVPEREIH